MSESKPMTIETLKRAVKQLQESEYKPHVELFHPQDKCDCGLEAAEHKSGLLAVHYREGKIR